MCISPVDAECNQKTAERDYAYLLALDTPAASIPPGAIKTWVGCEGLENYGSRCTWAWNLGKLIPSLPGGLISQWISFQ